MPAGALRTATGEHTTPTEELIADLLARKSGATAGTAGDRSHIGIRR
jgi:hypothetical protein